MNARTCTFQKSSLERAPDPVHQHSATKRNATQHQTQTFAGLLNICCHLEHPLSCLPSNSGLVYLTRAICCVCCLQGPARLLAKPLLADSRIVTSHLFSTSASVRPRQTSRSRFHREKGKASSSLVSLLKEHLSHLPVLSFRKIASTELRLPHSNYPYTNPLHLGKALSVVTILAQISTKRRYCKTSLFVHRLSYAGEERFRTVRIAMKTSS